MVALTGQQAIHYAIWLYEKQKSFRYAINKTTASTLLTLLGKHLDQLLLMLQWWICYLNSSV